MPAPHPSVHLVTKSGNASRLHGVPTGRFTRVLEGRDRVLILDEASGWRPSSWRGSSPRPAG